MNAYTAANVSLRIRLDNSRYGCQWLWWNSTCRSSPNLFLSTIMHCVFQRSFASFPTINAVTWIVLCLLSNIWSKYSTLASHLSLRLSDCAPLICPVILIASFLRHPSDSQPTLSDVGRHIIMISPNSILPSCRLGFLLMFNEKPPNRCPQASVQPVCEISFKTAFWATSAIFLPTCSRCTTTGGNNYLRFRAAVSFVPFLSDNEKGWLNMGDLRNLILTYWT